LKSLIMDFKKESGIHAELAELKETMSVLFDVLGVQRNGRISSPLSKVYYHLISVGVSKERAGALIEKLKTDGSTVEPSERRWEYDKAFYCFFLQGCGEKEDFRLCRSCRRGENDDSGKTGCPLFIRRKIECGYHNNGYISDRRG